MTGSPLHLYQDTPETRREVDLMRAVFKAGVPSFGSCAGLQVAVAAAQCAPAAKAEKQASHAGLR
ncbi:hypothetical protein BB934_43115 (plasmid) [Microvirga ossetica]|uniref:Uncharacterized protein n=1 Tax=Microvirga ossetica TaxID=1882682 RepID=A0A1B2EYF5_9HYPH|nr:hypothetical protein BB934_43115 [Microvirga ossetica]